MDGDLRYGSYDLDIDTDIGVRKEVDAYVDVRGLRRKIRDPSYHPSGRIPLSY